MKRFGIVLFSAIVFSTGFADVVSASKAPSNALKICLEKASTKRQQAIKSGTPRATADKQWLADVKACQRKHTQALSVPRSDRDPKIPKPWNEMAQQQPITDPSQCGDRVALVDENGRIVCVDVDVKISGHYCDRFDKRQCRGRIIRSLPPVSDDSKSAPEGTDVYPGLPPAPPQPSEDSNLAYRGSGRKGQGQVDPGSPA